MSEDQRNGEAARWTNRGSIEEEKKWELYRPCAVCGVMDLTVVEIKVDDTSDFRHMDPYICERAKRGLALTTDDPPQWAKRLT